MTLDERVEYYNYLINSNQCNILDKYNTDSFFKFKFYTSTKRVGNKFVKSLSIRLDRKVNVPYELEHPKIADSELIIKIFETALFRKIKFNKLNGSKR